MIGISWLISLEVYIDCNISLVWWEINPKHWIPRVNQQKIKSSRKEYVMSTSFKFCPKTFSENYKPMGVWFLACLQVYRELLSLVTFLRVHSNSEKVSYLSWQNAYPNLKTSCYIKLKSLLRTKLLENLLVPKYLISVAASLNINN